ncbi:MAG: hypothetical protein ACPGPF_07115 [Pontibacterium sp.]
MLKQRVNFYIPKTPPARDIWSLSSLILLFFLVCFISIFSGWSLSKYAEAKDKRVALLSEQKESLPMQIAEEEAQRKLIKPNPAILDAIVQVEAKIADKRKLLGLLNQMQPNESEDGFSTYLYGLASASSQETWLTAFELDLLTGVILLRGQAKAAESVPPMLSDLVVDSAFSGMKITQLDMEKSEEAGHLFEVKAMLSMGEDE